MTFTFLIIFIFCDGTFTFTYFFPKYFTDLCRLLILLAWKKRLILRSFTKCNCLTALADYLSLFEKIQVISGYI